MRSIINSQALPSPLARELKHNPQLRFPDSTPFVTRLSQIEPAIAATALPSDIVTAASSPSAAAKLSVIIPTSAVFLVAYWVANFVVPGMVLKDLQSDSNGDDDEEQNPAKDD